MSLTLEYEALRAELLQLYSEQSTLAFVSGITSAAIIFGLLQTPISPGIGVLVWHLILVGIAWKLTSNYDRIYRIAAYLKIVHELKANPSYIPTNDQPAWHYRTRLIRRKPSSTWKWGSGARADGLFLRLLGFAGALFLILASLSTGSPIEGISWILVGISSYVFLWIQTQRLFSLRKVSDEFEQELWHLVAEDLLDTRGEEVPNRSGSTR